VLNELNGTVVSFAFDPVDGSTAQLDRRRRWRRLQGQEQLGGGGGLAGRPVPVRIEPRPRRHRRLRDPWPSRRLRLGHQATEAGTRAISDRSSGRFLVVANPTRQYLGVPASTRRRA
jgi:hypothetical protein